MIVTTLDGEREGQDVVGADAPLCEFERGLVEHEASSRLLAGHDLNVQMPRLVVAREIDELTLATQHRRDAPTARRQHVDVNEAVIEQVDGLERIREGLREEQPRRHRRANRALWNLRLDSRGHLLHQGVELATQDLGVVAEGEAPRRRRELDGRRCR